MLKKLEKQKNLQKQNTYFVLFSPCAIGVLYNIILNLSIKCNTFLK